MLEDLYLTKKLNLLKSCKNDNEIKTLLNKIYEDGFEDGINQ